MKISTFLLLTSCLFLPAVTLKAENNPAQTIQSERAKTIWQRDYLLGDWGGTRTDWEEKGISIEMDYTGEVWGFMSGGVERGTLYQGLLTTALVFDLDKLIGWKGGSLKTSTIMPHNTDTDSGGTTRYTGSAYDTSNISAYETVRLYDLWFEQNLLDDKFSLRLGQFGADDEFYGSDTAGLFLGATFGWGNNLAANLPNGGPAYPVAGLGARAKIQPIEEFYLMSAVFEGDVGNQAGNNKHGVEFNLDDDEGIFVINEIGYLLNQGENATGLPGSYKFGGWVHSGNFSDFLFDDQGLSLADPASSGMTALNRGSWGVYFIADQMVYRPQEATDQGLSLFWRIAGGPDKTSTIPFYTDFGATYKGLIPCRNEDVIGIAFALQSYSDDLVTAGNNANSFNGTNDPLPGNEAVLELTYQIHLSPWWYVQPDFQYIINPAGGALDPNTGNKIQNAVVIGLRTGIVF